MTMTREQVLAEMEADFVEMDDATRDRELFSRDGQMWTPRLLIQEVRNNTEVGKWFADGWEAAKNPQQQLLAMLAMAMGVDPASLAQSMLLDEGDLLDEDEHVHGPDCHHDDDDEEIV